MNDRDVLTELESLGSEQTRKTYKRHGVGDKQYGVRYASLGKLTEEDKDGPRARAEALGGGHS